MKKTNFDLSHERLMTAKPDGTLYPVLVEDCIPGDIWKGNTQIFARLLPLVSPIYQRFDIYLHYFFVPYELLWDNWKNFIAPENIDSNLLPEGTEYVFPAFGIKAGAAVSGYADNSNFNVGYLADYMGLRMSQTGVQNTTGKFSSMPFRAYQLIWNEHYRDIDLQNPIEIVKTDGYDDATESAQFVFLNRNLEKDYFTSARPYAQKGDPASVITSVPSVNSNIQEAYINVGVDGVYTPIGGLQKDANEHLKLTNVAAGHLGTTEAVGFNTGAWFSIEQLRWANATQKFLEKLYRSGSRYTNILKSFYGVHARDQRLDRPEYIGGGRQPFNISEVLQTSQSDLSPLGTFGGRGITYGDHNFRYEVKEHGLIMGLMSIMPRVNYLNGIRRQLMHTDRFDFPIPDFANIGNQEIKTHEATGILEDESNTFGYTDRYAEYKFIPSTCHGAFRNDEYLKTFHCGRVCSQSEAIDADFIVPNWTLDIERIFATDSTNPVLLTVQNRIKALRPIPRVSIPNLF